MIYELSTFSKTYSLINFSNLQTEIDRKIKSHYQMS